MSSNEELLRQIEELARANSELAANVKKAEANAAAEKAKADAATSDLKTIQETVRQTNFREYILGVEQHLYNTFAIDNDLAKQSALGTTSVDNKYYPQHLKPWTEFTTTHRATFATFDAVFGNDGLFRSRSYLEETGRDLTPVPSDELDLRPFIRASIEKPAATVINRYLERTKDPTFRHICFRNNAYGLEVEGAAAEQQMSPPNDQADDPATADDNDGKRPAKRRSPIKTVGVPDRWLFATYHDGRVSTTLVGEYKAAHKLKSSMLAKVMSMPPGDDFFPRAIKTIDGDTDTATPGTWPQGSTFIARILCQAFHYMITTGLEFGYVASGDGLIFLRVLEDDPNTLYYFWNVSPGGQDPDVVGARQPEETAMAYMATLGLCALRSPQRSYQWIIDRNEDVKRWPGSKKKLSDSPQTVLTGHSRDGDDHSDHSSGGDRGEEQPGATEGGRPTGRQSARKRTRDCDKSQPSMPGQGQQTQTIGPYIVEPPTRPYCTQACLRGLCRGLPLDERCPNVALHRAASGDDQHAAKHPLTAADVRARIVTQLETNMDKDCECLDVYGLFGRHGVLFKLAVTGFGYTFVGKGVQAVHASVLERETAVYRVLRMFSGELMPVFLGVVELQHAIPLRSCAQVTHMMLLAHAGPDLIDGPKLADVVAAGVNLEAEAERTNRQLAAAGLLDEDSREANMVWNAEVARVMRVDFGLADINWERAGRLHKVKEEVQEVVQEKAVAPHSPLALKRDANAAVQAGPAQKRARRVAETVM